MKELACTCCGVKYEISSKYFSTLQRPLICKRCSPKKTIKHIIKGKKLKKEKTKTVSAGKTFLLPAAPLLKLIEIPKSYRKLWNVKWANRQKVKAIYKRAKKLGWSLDHIWPVKSNYGTGLEHELNLRIMPLKDNVNKSNKWPRNVSHKVDCGYSQIDLNLLDITHLPPKWPTGQTFECTVRITYKGKYKYFNLG